MQLLKTVSENPVDRAEIQTPRISEQMTTSLGMKLHTGKMVTKSGINLPVEVGSLSHYLQGFSTIPGGCLGFQPSTV